jgi:di/tricarboxylate transporter
MTIEILLVFGVLAVTIVLFVSEKLRIDLIALLIMVSLPWLGLIEPLEALSGLSSNAVVSIIAVMILGHGVDRSGIMARLTSPVLKIAGENEGRLTGVLAGTVGLVSGFMQNIGAAALFLPGIIRISKKQRIPASRLLMPVGFAAILGGTLTMIASSPLIMLNDLLKQGGEDAIRLFNVTPIGLVLLVSGIAYFLIFGTWVLPERTGEMEEGDSQEELTRAWGLLSSMYCVSVPAESELNGKMLDETSIWEDYNLHVIVMLERSAVHYAPWRYTLIREGQRMGLLGRQADVERFEQEKGLRMEEKRGSLIEELESGRAGGFAEVMVRPRASIANKTLREIALRRRYGVEPILLVSGSSVEHHDFSDQKLKPGDTLVVYGYWHLLRAIQGDKDLVLLTPIEPQEVEPSKQVGAALCFLGAIGLAIAGFPLSVSLLTGAVAMVLFRVTTLDEAYRAIDWRTVFLLAGLIPLGMAMEKTGAAAYVADAMADHLLQSHPLVILTAVAILATVFSLFMSNVAATVLLVPLVMMLGRAEGIDPRGLALLVAVCASNSFVLPTHQVNALYMSPGAYHNRDYLRAGGIMSILFIIVSVGMIYLFYLSR